MVIGFFVLLLVGGAAIHLRSQVELHRAARRDPSTAEPHEELSTREAASRVLLVVLSLLSIPAVLVAVYVLGARHSVRTGLGLTIAVFLVMGIAFVPLVFALARRELARELARSASDDRPLPARPENSEGPYRRRIQMPDDPAGPFGE